MLVQRIVCVGFRIEHCLKDFNWVWQDRISFIILGEMIGFCMCGSLVSRSVSKLLIL
jgi:hypothetical protein